MGDSAVRSVSLGQDVRIYCHTFYNSYGSGAVVFKSDGSASCSGNVVLTDDQWMHHSDIDVLASIGRVKLSYQCRDESY